MLPMLSILMSELLVLAEREGRKVARIFTDNNNGLLASRNGPSTWNYPKQSVAWFWWCLRWTHRYSSAILVSSVPEGSNNSCTCQDGNCRRRYLCCFCNICWPVNGSVVTGWPGEEPARKWTEAQIVFTSCCYGGQGRKKLWSEMGYSKG